MSEKPIKKISPKLENNIKGIFLILLAVVLAINVGPIARTFAFPLIYFFGIGIYLILGYVLFLGIFRLIRGEKFTFVHLYNRIGFIFLLISIMFFVGFAWVKINNYDFSQGVQKYITDLHNSLSSYYTTKVINMFEAGAPYSSGLIFMSIIASIKNEFASCGFGIAFLLASLALTLPFFIKNKKEIKTKEKELQEGIKKANAYQIEEVKPVAIQPEPDVQFGFEPEDSSFDENEAQLEPVSMSLDDTFGADNKPLATNGEFSRLSFFDGASMNEPQTIKQPEPQAQPEKTNEYQEIDNEEIIDIEAPNFEDSYLDENVIKKPEVIIEEPKPSFVPPIINEAPIVQTPFTPIVEPQKIRERVKWTAPSNELLTIYETSEAIELNTKVANERVEIINKCLSDFKIGAQVVSFTIGSSVTRFNIQYEPNVSIKIVEKYVDDISLRLNGVPARFTPLVQGEAFSGLEVPNATITMVGFREIYDYLPDVKKHPLAVAFGKNISGNVVYADYDEFPHLLVAGTTGSGKSIYIHSVITTLIMRNSPDDLKIVLVDPKRVEMKKYEGIPHLLCPIINEAPKVKVLLDKLVVEMNDRYDKFSIADNSSNVKQYNEWAVEHNEPQLPYIIIVLDEYADLIDNCKEISQPVVSIAQKARAAGIHLLISTQRPSTNVITGVIKGNLPTHVALMTSSSTDSVTILGEGGAEKLLGKGDMLVQSPLVSRVGATRLQGCFISNKEIGHIVGYLKEHYQVYYDEKFLDLIDHSKEVAQQSIASGDIEREANDAEEAKYQSIKEWVMCQEFVSMSKIQRDCAVGFNRAGRFFTRLQKEGIVSTTQDGSTKGCKVLVHDKFSNYGEDVGSDELID